MEPRHNSAAEYILTKRQNMSLSGSHLTVQAIIIFYFYWTKMQNSFSVITRLSSWAGRSLWWSRDDDKHEMLCIQSHVTSVRTAKGHVMCRSGDIALNPKSKLALECGTNRNTGACLSIHYRHPQRGEMPVISWMLFRRHEVGIRGCGHASLEWDYGRL